MATFTVIDTRSNSKKVFESSATNVKELKEDLRVNGISTDNIVIQEALTLTELLSDVTNLPKDVNFKGTITSNLVFRITGSRDKIKSGMYSRAELYSIIKVNNLQEDIKEIYGANFTNVSTANLQNFVDDFAVHNEEEVVESVPCSCIYEEMDNSSNTEKALVKLVEVLYNNGTLNNEDATKIKNVLSNQTQAAYSEEELDEILNKLS